MKRPVWGAARLAGLALLVTIAGCVPLPAARSPRYRAVAVQPGDGVTFQDSIDAVTIDVTSERGIGSVEIERLGLPPKTLTVNVHLTGLEELRFSWGDTRLFVHVASSDGSVSEEVSLGAKQATSIDSTSSYWAPVRIEAQDPEIPLANGFFAVTAPAAFLQAAPQRFALEWIDFYR
ncbi:MAG: hypothetical protein ACM30E_01045 [Nitrososphaerales archaeon]